MRGITSNPTIFANAISGQDTYDDQFRALMKDHTVDGAYWEMAITDITNALDMLRPLYDESDGEDGFVSLEVSPAQAHETGGHGHVGPRPARRASTSPTSSSRCRPRRRACRPSRP